MEAKLGNKKIGRDTVIFNITSATDCPSRKLNLCQIPTNCYALRPERRWIRTLPYRRRQNRDWDRQSVKEIAKDIYEIVNKNTKYVRYSESGDFRIQEDIEKMVELTEEMSELIFYGYTARKDLSFKNLPKNFIVNGSGFMLDNSFTCLPRKMLNRYQIICSTNCRICNLCKEKKGRVIFNAIH
jgi:hypothetical protein